MSKVKITQEDIKNLCYELYKRDWLKQNVTASQELLEYRRYFLNKMSSEKLYDDENYTLEEHLKIFGYNTKLYLSYEEFCETAFLNNEYINYLLGDKAIYRNEHLRQLWNLYLDCFKT